ncbi:MAG: hypothetical protein EXS14_02050 [Planctomycetes bacterium]|nr:hypothetical protein [Planctomycetota bacterium]
MHAYVAATQPPSKELLGIELNAKGQQELLHESAAFTTDVPFSEKQTPAHRYFYDNGWFSDSDAIFLYCFLRKNQPKRIIEVGSGFSSAVMLDTVDACFSLRPEMTFIEPYPARLLSLLRDSDREHVSIIAQPIQTVPLDTFLAL